MAARWQTINGVTYPVVECWAPDEDREKFVTMLDLFKAEDCRASPEEMEKSKKLREDLAAAKKELARLKEKKKFEDLEKENNKWEILATEEKNRLKKDARQQCLELVDDTLPPGVNLTQDEDGWGGAWTYDFLQEANSFWGSLPSDVDKAPNKKGNNVSVAATSAYILADQPSGQGAIEFSTELKDGQDIVSPKKLFSDMVVHWYEGNKGLGGISVEDWRNFGFWGSTKFMEMKESPAFGEVIQYFVDMQAEIEENGKSKFISKGTPIKVDAHVHWPIINKLYEGYKAELPKKFSFNAQACEFVPGQIPCI